MSHSTNDGGTATSDHAVPHVPDMMLADPDVDHRQPGDARSKALEAAQESSSSSPALPRSMLIQARPPSVYSDAPPAYSPSASLPPNTADYHDSSTNYSTFDSTMGSSFRDGETDPLLARTPQSMGGRPADEEAGRPPSWNQRVRSRMPSWLNWKVGLAIVILFAIALGFILAPFLGHKDDTTTLKPSLPIDKSPGQHEGNTPVGDNAPIFSPSSCRYAKYRFNDVSLALNPKDSKDVAFVEDRYDSDGRSSVSVSGAVSIQRIKNGQSPQIRVQMVTNDEDLRIDVRVYSDPQLVRVSIPSQTETKLYDRMPCVEIRTTIWLPADAKLGELAVDVIALDIYTLDDLSIHLTKLMKLSSVAGDIVSGGSSVGTDVSIPSSYLTPPEGYVLDSRVIKVSTTSGKINGHFPLYDVLDFHTTSGSISTSITPHEELFSAPKPAALSIRATSGSVRAQLPVYEDPSEIPKRDYLLHIRSVSGSVRGHFYQGSEVRAETTSGKLDLTLLPVIDSDHHLPSNPVTLETSTTSSSSNVEILEPIWFGSSSSDGRALNLLKARHETTSGSINLVYPQAWEGRLTANTTSGKLTVSGRDVEVTRSRKGWVGAELEARKGSDGDAGSETEVRTLSGNLVAKIGDQY